MTLHDLVLHRVSARRYATWIGIAFLVAFLTGCTASGPSSSVSTQSGTATASTSATSSTPQVTTVAAKTCADPIDYSSVPASPTAVAGPAASHVDATTKAGSLAGSPTTYFKVNSTTWVPINVTGVPAGETHVISVAWYYFDQKIDLPNPAQMQQTTTGNATLGFGLSYPYPGVGQVRVYSDLPQSDATLAQTLTFGVHC